MLSFLYNWRNVIVTGGAIAVGVVVLNPFVVVPAGKRGVVMNFGNIAFSPEFSKSIESKQIAEQEAKQAEYEALKASKQAEAEVNRAKGKAEAQRLLQTSLTQELIQQEAIAKWDGQFPNVMTGDGALPFVNINAAQ